MWNKDIANILLHDVILFPSQGGPLHKKKFHKWNNGRDKRG